LIYIAIVSHGHFELIRKNLDLVKIAKLDFVSVIVKDNVGDDSLKSYCLKHDLTYIDDNLGLGFGENNNYIYNFISSSFLVQSDDHFVVMNPDLYISYENFLTFSDSILVNPIEICTVDLFKDDKLSVRDPFIRKFPRLIDFFQSFIFKKNNTIIDRTHGVGSIDWCAGSFMCFKWEVYLALKGFDEGYFMYCEDIDICYRANILNYSISYLGNVQALHYAQHTNRALFSKHFFWHIKSIARFLIVKNLSQYSLKFFIKQKSIIK